MDVVAVLVALGVIAFVVAGILFARRGRRLDQEVGRRIEAEMERLRRERDGL